MSETSGIRTIGGILVVIGALVLVFGLAMSATSTFTSETCVDSPTGFGQECMSGSVTTANPLKGTVTGTGLLVLLGGIGVIMVGGGDSHHENSSKSGATIDGSLAERVRERGEDRHTDQLDESETSK